MFVLPPPPRYPNGNLYTGLPGGGGLLETQNTLEHPTGPEYQLVVGEGTYVLRDDLHIATPPPHPSDAPVPNNNPLATTIGLPTAGTRLSLVILAPRKPPSQNLFRIATAASARSAIPQSIQEETQSPRDDFASISGANDNGTNDSLYGQAAAFGDGNPALASAPVKGSKDPSKRTKPKNNIIKSNSSFVSRVIPHESLQRRLNDRSPEGLMAFANVNRAFQWLDLASDEKKENLTKVLFTKANALCHDVNTLTKSQTHLDIILGFNTSDIIWYEPMSQKYARVNKNGLINPSAISSIHWLPNSENLFLASHIDGTLVIYDKEKEDAQFVPEEGMENGYANGHSNGAGKHSLHILKSVTSRNQKTNPVAIWKISKQKVNMTAFSPDGTHLAVVSQDGTLTILDYLAEKILDIYHSYYGGLHCVTWSPDGRYVLTGGQDDLVSIWSLADCALVARCQGHESWVTDVKFDPWRCDERNYRFGSVGEDCRLLLWDFSVGMLGRPKATSIRQRGSVASHVPMNRIENYSANGRLRSSSNLTQDELNGGEMIHPVDSRSSTAFLPPVMSKTIDDHPLCWVGFEEDCIIITCKDGHVRTWDRPKESATDDEKRSSASGSR